MRSSLTGQMRFSEGCCSALRGTLRFSPISSLDIRHSCYEEEKKKKKEEERGK
jgi:hypothetical protein